MCHCERAMELMSLRLDGMLTPEEGRELEEHLDRCPPCGSLARELEELQRFMPQEEPVPEGFHAGVMERVRQEKVLPLAAARPKKKYNPWKSLAAMAAVFAVVLTGTGTFRHFTQLDAGETGKEQSPPITTAQPEQERAFDEGGQDGAASYGGGPEAQSLDEVEGDTPADAGTEYKGTTIQEPETAGAGIPADAPSETALPEPAPRAAMRSAVAPKGMETGAPEAPVESHEGEAAAVAPASVDSAAVDPASVDPASVDPAPAEAGVSPQMAQFSMNVNLAEDAGEISAPEAVEQAVLWLAQSDWERKDQIDVSQADVAPITEEELALVVCLEGSEGLLDGSDWVVTLGDAAGPDWAQVVCDSESDQVIGYLNQA